MPGVERFRRAEAAPPHKIKIGIEPCRRLGHTTILNHNHVDRFGSSFWEPGEIAPVEKKVTVTGRSHRYPVRRRIVNT